MFGRFERLVAFRYLRARRQEGFISVIAGFSLLGICLGVATLIIVMSVMNGFRSELLGRVLGLNGHVLVLGYDRGIDDYEALTDRILQMPRVQGAVPIVEGQVLASFGSAAAGAMVRGIRPEDLAGRPELAAAVSSQALAAFAEDRVVVGSRLARRLGLGVGDEITLLSPEGKATPFGVVPRVRAYEVVGLFEIGMYEYDNAFIFLPLEAAQAFFSLPDQATQIELFLDDPAVAPAVRQSITRELGAPARDWQQLNSSFFNALQVERNVMFLILTLIILVAAFNIISGMIMLVKDKSRDIAILRTMGATRGMVMRIFLLSGASIGLVGTSAGVGLGLLFCDNIESIRRLLESFTGTELFAAEIYFLSRLPAEVEPMEVVSVVLMALGLSFLATLYPSWRAARLDPVEALRYE